MIALRDFILKYYCKERSRVYLGSAYLHLISFPSKKDFGFFGKPKKVEVRQPLGWKKKKKATLNIDD